MAWVKDGMAMVKVPLTPQRIAAVEEAVGGSNLATRRYSVGGNLLWSLLVCPTRRRRRWTAVSRTAPETSTPFCWD